MQVVRKVGGRTEVIKYFGSAHDDGQLAVLYLAAESFLGRGQQLSLPLEGVGDDRRIPVMDDFADYRHRDDSVDQQELDLGAVQTHTESVHAAQDSGAGDRLSGSRDGQARVVDTANKVLWQVLARVWDVLDFGIDDPSFQAMVIARIVEPTSKAQVGRVLTGLGQPSRHVNTWYNTLKRAVKNDYRARIGAACHRYVRSRHQVTMVLYDVTTLYFETPKEDELRKVGMSKERRVDPQIVVGLITDLEGFPLHVEFFHGKTAETTTLIPMINAYIQAHDLVGVVVVADAAMLSAKNLDALDAEGIDYIVADRLKKAPYDITLDPDDEDSIDAHDGAIVETTKTMGTGTQAIQRRAVIGFSAKRYRYDISSLDKQRQKAHEIATKKRSARLPRFVAKKNGQFVINGQTFAQARGLAGWKGYVTSIDAQQVDGSQIIGFYHQLYHIEQAFRMAKTDLDARPMYHHTETAITAHITVVFAALALSKHIYLTTNTTAPKLVQRLSTYRHSTIEINNTRITIPPAITPKDQQLINTLTQHKPGD
nr:IS1634 family transposase [Corynebacterium cystitidis]